MISPENLTVRAQQALARAQRLATDAQHAEVAPLHLFTALLDEDQGGVITQVLEKAGTHLGRLREITDSELARLPKVSGENIAAAGTALTNVLLTAE